MKTILAAMILAGVAQAAPAQNRTVFYPKDTCHEIVSQTTYGETDSLSVMRFDILCRDVNGAYTVLSDTWRKRTPARRTSNPRTFTLVPYDGEVLRFDEGD